MCFFPLFSPPFLFPWYLELRRLLGEFITSGIFKGRETEVSLAFSFQGKSPRSVWYVHEWHEKKAVSREGENMPRIVNYAKKKIACPKEWCVWLYSPDGVQHSGRGPCQTVRFSESASELRFSDPPVMRGPLVSQGVTLHLLLQWQPWDVCFDESWRDQDIPSPVVGTQFPETNLGLSCKIKNVFFLCLFMY